MTLADFWSKHEVVYGKNEQPLEVADDDFDDENLETNDPECSTTYTLNEGFGFIRKRKHPAVLR